MPALRAKRDPRGVRLLWVSLRSGSDHSKLSERRTEAALGSVLAHGGQPLVGGIGPDALGGVIEQKQSRGGRWVADDQRLRPNSLHNDPGVREELPEVPSDGRAYSPREELVADCSSRAVVSRGNNERLPIWLQRDDTSSWTHDPRHFRDRATWVGHVLTSTLDPGGGELPIGERQRLSVGSRNRTSRSPGVRSLAVASRPSLTSTPTARPDGPTHSAISRTSSPVPHPTSSPASSARRSIASIVSRFCSAITADTASRKVLSTSLPPLAWPSAKARGMSSLALNPIGKPKPSGTRPSPSDAASAQWRTHRHPDRKT